MSTGPLKKESFVFLIDILARQSDNIPLEPLCREGKYAILNKARELKAEKRDGAFRLRMTCWKETDDTGNIGIRFELQIPDPIRTDYTFRCDMEVVNGVVETFFFDNANGTKRRLESWMRSGNMDTSTAVGDNSSVRDYSLFMARKITYAEEG
jgi:hypothetical protein